MAGTAAEEVASAQRIVRVFVSSTFRDMQADRDELVKHVFPRLRKLCESRGVTWGEVDLRWGITDEQTAEGKVLPVCLAEIRGCRPYFLGLLGERYGWVPEEIDPALIEQEPWLRTALADATALAEASEAARRPFIGDLSALAKATRSQGISRSRSSRRRRVRRSRAQSSASTRRASQSRRGMRCARRLRLPRLSVRACDPP